MNFRLAKNLLRTLGGQVTLLAAVMLLLFAAMSPFIGWLQGREMLAAAAMAGGVCFAASLLAMVGEKVFCGRNHAAMGLYWSMMIRTGLPLMAAMIAKLSGGPLAAPAAICYLLVFYFGSLIVQVALSYCATNESQGDASPRGPLR